MTVSPSNGNMKRLGLFLAAQRDQWMRTILPIGALFSGSLILSNFAYLSLSVSFIQMLKVSPCPGVPNER
jgi:hypothetical protein